MRRSFSLLMAALVLVSAPSALYAKDKMRPVRDFNALRKEVGRDPVEMKKRAEAYLAQWGSKPATGSNRYALAQFQQAAERYKEAAEGFRAVRTDDEGKLKTRDFAATAEAGVYLTPGAAAVLGQAAIDKGVADLTKFAAGMDSDSRKKSRVKLLTALARLHAAAGRQKEAHAMRMQVIDLDVKKLPSLARPIMSGLLSSTCALSKFDAVRAQAAAVMKTLRDKQGAIVAEKQAKFDAAAAKLRAAKPAALDGDGNLKETNTRAMSKEEKAYLISQRSLNSAKKDLAGLDKHEPPFALLGKAAPAWTLEKAFGEVEALDALKGKVVVLDFWNTWGTACNFPVLRDLLKAYGEKGLAVVGVTASGNVVYPTRYDMDEDMASKREPGARKQYAARLASERHPANGSYILEEEAYRAAEIEAIAAFLENHQISWPNVMIDKDEPASKFAQGTWPHTVLLDKQGRVRLLHGGEIARHEAAEVAMLRKAIETLLAE